MFRKRDIWDRIVLLGSGYVVRTLKQEVCRRDNDGSGDDTVGSMSIIRLCSEILIYDKCLSFLTVLHEIV